MINFIKGAISILLLIGLLCLGVWFAAVDNTNKKWELRLARADHKIDSLLRVEHIPVPPETVHVGLPAKPSSPDYRAAVDSAFDAGKAAGVDSLKALFDYLAEPWTPRVIFSSGDTVLCDYKPLTHTGSVTLLRAPMLREVLTVYDSMAYTLPAVTPRPWYEIPAVLALGIIVGVFLDSELKN